jgi:hypothetical protein
MGVVEQNMTAKETKLGQKEQITAEKWKITDQSKKKFSLMNNSRILAEYNLS